MHVFADHLPAAARALGAKVDGVMPHAFAVDFMPPNSAEGTRQKIRLCHEKNPFQRDPETLGEYVTSGKRKL
jgi:hypothetical protein